MMLLAYGKGAAGRRARLAVFGRQGMSGRFGHARYCLPGAPECGGYGGLCPHPLKGLG